MPRPPKPLEAFPSYCVTIWDAIVSSRLNVSDTSDPAGYPLTQYLDFPDRRTCEATRHNLTKYRDAFGKLAHRMPNRGKPGSSERESSEHSRLANTLFFNQMMSYSVSIRNMQYPRERKFSSVYSLPDGPHRLYLIARGVDIEQLLLSQVKPPQERKPDTNASRLVGVSSPAQRVLEELGYSPSRSRETIPLSDDELFEEDPSDA